MRRISLSLSLALSALLLASISSAQQASTTAVPNLIRYGGILYDVRGAPLASATTGVTFAIYKQQDGGAPVWMETQNVTTDATGNYSVLLGSTTATGLPSDLFSQQEQRWLGVQMQGEAEQSRVLLVSVPYAMHAAEAERLIGHGAGDLVTTDNLQITLQQMQQNSGVLPNPGMQAVASSSPPLSPANGATKFIDSTADQVVLVQQNGTGIGLSASSQHKVGVLGTVNSRAQIGISAGVEGTSTVLNGYGVFGYSRAGVGVRAESDSDSGIALEGRTTGATSTAIAATSNAIIGHPVGLSATVSAPDATGAVIANLAQGTITGPLLIAKTNAGAQFSVDGSGNVSSQGGFTGLGNVKGKQLIATMPSGTAPLQVTSTTIVPNLNASLLGGHAAGDFALATGSASYIWNGTSQQSNASFNISGNGTAGGTLAASAMQVSASSNQPYQIAASSQIYGLLGIGNADSDLFIGPFAGTSNVARSGTYNTFTGWNAGYYNTIGYYNTFTGADAGRFNTTGNNNTFTGAVAGSSNTTAYNNTFTGAGSGTSNTTGHSNTFTGAEAGTGNTTGDYNTFYGAWAGAYNTTGDYNTFIGMNAGGNTNTTTTHHNIFLGLGAGWLDQTGNSNIFIGSQGVSPGTESNTIRLGTQGSGDGQQNVAYVAGIYGATTSSGSAVFIDSNGKLGTSGGTAGAVTSFNGRSGAVMPELGDYSFSLLSGTLGSSQLSGTYSNALSLSNTGNNFTGNGSGLTGIPFSNLSGTLGSAQFSGTYSNAVTLSSTSNAFTGSFTGNGSGLTGVPVASGSGYYIWNGTSQQSSSNFNISGLGTANAFNSATNYQIGGSAVLSMGSGTDHNLFVGFLAGSNNTGGQGLYNVFVGTSAGASNTTGRSNVFTGVLAGFSNLTGSYNSIYGRSAGYYSTGNANSYFGYSAASNNTTGSNNIYLGSQGCASTCGENNTIRIGGDVGLGYGPQTAAYIAGIYGAATNSGTAVFVDSNGKLGTSGGSGLVSSFNGRSGAVVPASGDYSFSLLSGNLGSTQLSGTYSTAVTLSNSGNTFTGSFTGNGSGLTGVPPAAGSPNYIQNGTALQSNSNFNISGFGAAYLMSASAYLLGSFNGLSINGSSVFVGPLVGTGGTGNANTFLGTGAGHAITSGSANTFIGYDAGANATAGYDNTFVGESAGIGNGAGNNDTYIGYDAGNSGDDNTMVGFAAGYYASGNDNLMMGSSAGVFNTGSYNTFLGYQAGYGNGLVGSNGYRNTFVGNSAGTGNTTGYYNTFLGDNAAAGNTTGFNNVAIGADSGYSNQDGSLNVYLGVQAGMYNKSGSGNVYIGSVFGTLSDSQATYIANVYGTNVSGSYVTVNNNGQVGVLGSSRRFKDSIQDMGPASDKLFQLRPVTFFYKPEYQHGSPEMQYGLIAEEVAKVFPEMVSYDKDGQPYTVKYQYLAPMLLNEVQKQYRRTEEQAEVIQAQQQEINELKQRLSRLETLVGAQVKISGGAASSAGAE